MGADELTPEEVARWAVRLGLPAPVERPDLLAAAVNQLRQVLVVLHDLDLDDTAPAAVYRVAHDEERHDATS